LRKGNRKLATEILNTRNKDQLFTIPESWLLKVFNDDQLVEEEFLALDPKIKNLIYKSANRLENIECVKKTKLFRDENSRRISRSSPIKYYFS
jgi:hypothetical protein